MVVLALLGWGGYEIYGTANADASLGKLLSAKTTEVPDIVADMLRYRRWIDQPLRRANMDAKARKDPSKQLHTSLALFEMDGTQADYLYHRLLDAEPGEIKVIRDFLAKESRLDQLWAVVEKAEKGKERQRLRAAAALAKFDPKNERWGKVSAAVVNDLVLENPVFLPQWRELFSQVKKSLVRHLSEIFKKQQPENTAERIFATNLLADYAADNPQCLAELLIVSDAKQFSVIYPIFVTQVNSSALLEAVLNRRVDTPYASILSIKESKDIKTQTESPVKIEGTKEYGSLATRLYSVPMKKGKTYTMTLASTEVKPLLVLHDSTGKQLDIHDGDDGGRAGKCPFLVFTAPKDDKYNLYVATDRIGSFSLDIIESDAKHIESEALAKQQANAAVALLKMNLADNVWPWLKPKRNDNTDVRVTSQSTDARVRSYLVHRLGPLGADARVIIKQLDEQRDLEIRRALLLCLGEYGEKDFSLDNRKALLPKLQEIFRTATDPGFQAAAEWLLRVWNQEVWLGQENEKRVKEAKEMKDDEQRLASIKNTLKKKEKQLYVNTQGQTMVVLPGPVTFFMGSPSTEEGRDHYDEHLHLRTIGRTFAIASKAVTVEQYERFNKEHKRQLLMRYVPTPDCPVHSTTWYDAAAYCNWLSKQDKIPKSEWCYAELERIEAKNDERPRKAKAPDASEVWKFTAPLLKPNYLTLTGYRLPTEAEWEYACRAGATTSRYYGENVELLAKYAWHLQNCPDEGSRPVGRLKPNDFGLFDMHGNVWCWCLNKYTVYPDAACGMAVIEDKEEESDVLKDHFAFRGGSWGYPASNVRAAFRTGNEPMYFNRLLGFRVARTISTN